MTLYFIIAAYIIFSIILLSYLYRRKINETNATRIRAAGSIAGIVFGIPTLIAVGYQVLHLQKTIELQHDTFLLENRPFLFVSLKNLRLWKNVNEGDVWFGGGDLYIINKGKTPAKIITKQAKYIVASNEYGDCGMMKWFEGDAGGYQHVTTVFPGQEDAFVPMHPIIGQNPKVIYFGALIPYVGLDPDKLYWYKFTQSYLVKFRKVKDENGIERLTSPSMPFPAKHDWDRNEGSKLPKLISPDSETLNKKLLLPWSKLWLER